MNSIAQQMFPVLDMTLAMRHQLLDIITDADLSFALPHNPTLGTLCREMGETDRMYIDSFKTFKHAWGYRHDDASVEGSTDKLRAWYTQNADDLKAAVSALSEADVQGKMIDRGHGGMQFPAMVQLQVYREALLIFYAKVSVYLRAMDKPLPEQLQTWIG